MQIKEEEENLRYLAKHSFDKTFPKLVKSLKGKNIIIYGAGPLFQLIKKHYDISDLNIIGIADKKYETSTEEVSELGYKIFRLDEIANSGADYILVSVKFYISVIEDLHERFKATNIKIKPLVQKSLWTILKEL